MKHFDILVLGSGPAGHHAAIQAAKLGKKVAVVEKRRSLGGVSVNTGTIPSKTMREAVVYLTGLRQRCLYGMSYAVKQDIAIEDIRFRTNYVVKIEGDVFLAQFQRNHVELIHGTASFLDPHRIQVSGAEGAEGVEDYTADVVVIATGTSPARSDRIPLDGISVLDSD